MSGYQGNDPKKDALRYGAQDLLQRPFGRDDLRARVEELVLTAPNPAATQAIPQEMLEALRRSAGLDGDGRPVTSDDLFGEILSDVEGGERQPVAVPGAEPPSPGPVSAKPSSESTRFDDALSGMFENPKPRSKADVKRDAEESAEKMLSETLAGLEIRPSASRSLQPPAVKSPPGQPEQHTGQEPPEKTPERVQAPTAPPRTEALKPPSAAPTPPPARVKPAASEVPPTRAVRR